MKKRFQKILGYDKAQPFRIFYARSSVVTLCLSCLIACFVVCAVVLLFFHPSVSLLAIVSCLLVCAGTMALGAFLLYKKASAIADPIHQVSESARKVAEGDFSVRLPEPEGNLRVEEIDDMVHSFNTMTEALESMEYMNKDFMSNVSHEFKTPITAISGFAEILQEGDIPEEQQKEYLGLIIEESHRLTHLADNMLQMSRLEHQTMVMRKEKVNLSEQLRHTCILLAEKWAEKEPEFDIDLPEIEMETDPDLSQQIWMNLIDNAIKYSGESPVVHVRGTNHEDMVTISIRDEGMGIPEEQQKRIFDQFYQGDTSRIRQGNGLGLSIVSRIIELLDGAIVCESTEGKGTTFTVTLEKSH